MANPKIEQLPSGSFHARVYLGIGADGKAKYKSITSATKSEVKHLIAVTLAERGAVSKTVTDMTVRDAIEAYITASSNIFSPATKRAYLSILRNRIPSLMPIRIRDLTRLAIQRAFNAESANHSPKTVRNVHALFTAACKSADPSFSDDVILPQKIKPDIHIPTDEQMRKIFDGAKGRRIELPIYLAAICGMRRSEIVALRWDHVDLDGGFLTIDSAAVTDENGKIVVKGTKTAAGTRRIRIFAPALDKLRASDHIGETVCGFSHPGKITDYFADLLDRLDIQHFRFHDLRHYAVSTMLSLNIPKNYIADYVGHEGERMIDEVYGHIKQNKKEAFADLADEHFKDLFF